jgi:hypothetical protein
VTLAWVVRHPRWGIIGLPLLALRYVRPKDIATIPGRYGWPFEAKLERAVRLVQWLVGWAPLVGQALGVVVDGGEAKAPFLKLALAAGVVLVGRRRKDAALRDVPSPLRPGQHRGPGRPRTSGAHRISLNLWAHALVALWAWAKRKKDLCDRKASPWDDAARRPSHADKRKALQRHSLEEAFSRTGPGRRPTRKFQRLIRGLIHLVS